MATKIMQRERSASSHRNRATPYPSTSPSALGSLAQSKPVRPAGTWAAEEHDRFLEAMALYPNGPWKSIADHVATRSVRQVQSHAQKYQEKVVRRMRGLRKSQRKGGDESDDEVGHRVVMGTYGKLRKRTSDEGELAAFTTPTSTSTTSTPRSAQSHTDTESIQSDSSDEGDVEPTTTSITSHAIEISISAPAMPMKTESLSLEDDVSTSSLLEQSSIECPTDSAPLRLSELNPGWFYLDDLYNKTLDLGSDKEAVVEEEGGALTGLPSLADSLDFFIEYLYL